MTLQPAQALSLLNGDFIGQQATRLAAHLDADALESGDLVAAVIEQVFSRPASAQEKADGRALMEKLTSQHGMTARQAKQLYCLSVMNWNEFLFVD